METPEGALYAEQLRLGEGPDAVAPDSTTQA